MYQFKYTLDDNDYLEFNKHHLLNDSVSKKFLLVTRLMLPVILAIQLLKSLLSYKDSTELIIQLLVYTLFSVIWIFIIKHLDILLMKVYIKLLKKYGKLPYGGDVLIRFEEDFFIETTIENETKAKYTSIARIAEGKNALYIYVSSLQAFVIPFSVFETTEQRDSFWSFINHKVVN